MNPTQIQTTLAPLVAILGGLLAAKVPFFDAGQWGQIIGAIIAFGAVVWGVVAGRQSALITTVANSNDVQNVKLSSSAPASLVSSTPDNVTK